MSDADAPRTWTDAELLARFHASRNQPDSSRTLGFHLLRVDQGKGENSRAGRSSATRWARSRAGS